MNTIQPKEKALELRNQFRLFVGVGKDADGELHNNYLVSKHIAKRSALLCVEHILETTKESVLPMGGATGFDYDNYWLDVKAEIEKL